MQILPQRTLTITNISFYVLVLFTCLGWMLFVIILREVTEHEPLKIVADLGIETFKAFFIGTAAAIAVDRYLKHALGETPEAVLKLSGIKHVHPSRAAAAPDLLRLVSKTRTLHVAGISLRDFLRNGSLQEVWETICKRLEDEHHKNVPNAERLRVRLLLLDPRSSEGHFRHDVEKGAIGGAGLPFDVPQGCEAVANAQRTIYKGAPNEFLQIRLYEHCPFSFVLSADSETLVEQYDYRDQSRRPSLPVLVYESGTAQYDELQFSLNTIWKHARKTEYKPYHPGTAKALEDSGLVNIFRRADRSLLTDREVEAIRATSEADTVDIMAITGRSYFVHPMSEQLRRRPGPTGSPLSVRFAIVNPVSQQAILRAIADHVAPDRLREELQRWTWRRHTETKLYKHVHETINDISQWHEDGCAIALHLYSSSIACALCLTPDAAFVEQYMYGRSKAFAEGRVLGGEYPVFEYQLAGRMHDDGAIDPRVEPEILKSTFNIVWDSFSISAEDYRLRDEAPEFASNLQRLREELGCTDSG